MLRTQRRVNNTGIRAFCKIPQVIDRGRLPTAANVNESLCLPVNFINGANLRSKRRKVLEMRLIALGVSQKAIDKLPLRVNRLHSSQDREPVGYIELSFGVQWDVERNPFASRGRGARAPGQILEILSVCGFSLGAQAEGKQISLAEYCSPANEIEIRAQVIGVKHFNSLPKIGRKKTALLQVAMKPKNAGVELEIVDFDAQLVSQSNVGPGFVPILRHSRWIRLFRVAFHLRFCQAAGQRAIGPIQRQVKPFFDLIVQLAANIHKSDLYVFPTVFAKTVAIAAADGCKFIQRTFNRPAARLNADIGVAPRFDSGLQRSRIVAGQRHEIDRAAESQRPVFKRVRASKNFGMAERAHIEVFQDGFAVALIVT